jgi:hypothetical protein
MLKYFANLPLSKLTLWCYLCWYLVIACYYFNPALTIWLNSLGLAALVGFALFLSTGECTIKRIKNQFWASFRLFLCPFLVSSFSSLVKGKGFVLVFSPHAQENFSAFLACASFSFIVLLIKKIHKQQAQLLLSK